MPNLVKKSQLWYIPELRESFTSRSAEVITTQNSQKHEQHEAEQLNHKLHTEWSRARAGDLDLTGKCDWKSDRKCSTWRIRRRFAAVLVYPGKSEYSLPPQWVPSPHSYLCTVRLKNGRNLSDMSRSTFKIGAAQLRFVPEITPKSPFVCEQKRP